MLFVVCKFIRDLILQFLLYFSWLSTRCVLLMGRVFLVVVSHAYSFVERSARILEYMVACTQLMRVGRYISETWNLVGKLPVHIKQGQQIVELGQFFLGMNIIQLLLLQSVDCRASPTDRWPTLSRLPVVIYYASTSGQ
jgi:hypothetical protein